MPNVLQLVCFVILKLLDLRSFMFLIYMHISVLIQIERSFCFFFPFFWGGKHNVSSKIDIFFMHCIFWKFGHWYVTNLTFLWESLYQVKQLFHVVGSADEKLLLSKMFHVLKLCQNCRSVLELSMCNPTYEALSYLFWLEHFSWKTVVTKNFFFQFLHHKYSW